jgi:hypothetical protein
LAIFEEFKDFIYNIIELIDVSGIALSELHLVFFCEFCRLSHLKKGDFLRYPMDNLCSPVMILDRERVGVYVKVLWEILEDDVDNLRFKDVIVTGQLVQITESRLHKAEVHGMKM